MGEITQKCKGCGRLCFPDDPKCKSCANQNNYINRSTPETNIDREMDWLFGKGLPTTSTNKQLWITTGRSGGKTQIQKDLYQMMQNGYFNTDVTAFYPVDHLTDRELEYIKADVDAITEFYNGWLGKENAMRLPKIEKVIFNIPATIVVWSDGTKTVVKAENEPYDEEKGLAMAIAKKALGNQGNYYELFKKWLPEDKVKPTKQRKGVSK